MAPIGWHVPSDTEWTTLITYLGGEIIAGGKMKSIGTSLWISPNTDATNVSGFTGLPGGFRLSTGIGYINQRGNWWSLSEYDTLTAWYRNLDYNNGNATKATPYKVCGYSVRCIKD